MILELILEPTGESLLHGVELAAEEMIGAGDKEQPFGFGSGGGDLRELSGRRKLVVVSTEEKLGDGAVGEAGVAIVLAIGVSRKAQCDEGADVGAGAGAAATGAQGHGGAKAESGGYDGQLVCVFKPVQRGQHIGGFGVAVMGAVAEAGAAKVETENGKAEAEPRLVEDLHGVVDNLVVHCAAAEGMGMADESGKGRVGGAFIEKGFKTASGAMDVEGLQAGRRRIRDIRRWSVRIRGWLCGCDGGRHSTHHSTPKLKENSSGGVLDGAVFRKFAGRITEMGQID